MTCGGVPHDGLQGDVHGGLSRSGLPPESAEALEERAPGEPVTLAESLMSEAGWGPENFGTEGPNPPYLRIGGKLWVTLTEVEPCFTSFRRDRGPFRS